MTERLNVSTIIALSPVFNPGGDFTVQADISADSAAKIDIEGQVDAAAPWVRLGTISGQPYLPMLRFAKCPNVRLSLRNNTEQKPVKAWSGE